MSSGRCLPGLILRMLFTVRAIEIVAAIIVIVVVIVVMAVPVAMMPMVVSSAVFLVPAATVPAASATTRLDSRLFLVVFKNRRLWFVLRLAGRRGHLRQEPVHEAALLLRKKNTVSIMNLKIENIQERKYSLMRCVDDIEAYLGGCNFLVMITAREKY